MGLYGPNEYFIKLYPEQFRGTSLFEILFFLFLFFLLMSAYYVYLRFFERRARMIIDDNEAEIGEEIDYGLFSKGSSYTILIQKLNNDEWKAYKLFRSKRRVSLRRGDLRKIIDYLNRNFGYNDMVVGMN